MAQCTSQQIRNLTSFVSVSRGQLMEGYLGVNLPGGPFAWGSICLGVHLPGGSFAWGSICLGVHLPGGPFAWGSICLGVHLPGGPLGVKCEWFTPFNADPAVLGLLFLGLFFPFLLFALTFVFLL